jgi:hypothetical protein
MKSDQHQIKIYQQPEERATPVPFEIAPQTAHWERSPRVPTLQTIIAQTKPLPPYSVLIGACDDGYHFFFDLDDPNPGSLLITGEPHTGKSILLRSIMESASLLNPPNQVRFSLVATRPHEWQDASVFPNLDLIAAPYQRESNTLVMKFSEIAKQRRSGRLRGPALILFIENLARFLERIDRDVELFLGWLIREGPKSKVWTVVTLDIFESPKINKKLLSSFGTKMISMTSLIYTLPPPNGGPDSSPNLSNAHGQVSISDPMFKVYLRDEGWIRFSVPRLE